MAILSVFGAVVVCAQFHAWGLFYARHLLLRSCVTPHFPSGEKSHPERYSLRWCAQFIMISSFPVAEYRPPGIIDSLRCSSTMRGNGVERREKVVELVHFVVAAVFCD